MTNGLNDDEDQKCDNDNTQEITENITNNCDAASDLKFAQENVLNTVLEDVENQSSKDVTEADNKTDEKLDNDVTSNYPEPFARSQSRISNASAHSKGSKFMFIIHDINLSVKNI